MHEVLEINVLSECQVSVSFNAIPPKILKAIGIGIYTEVVCEFKFSGHFT